MSFFFLRQVGPLGLANYIHRLCLIAYRWRSLRPYMKESCKAQTYICTVCDPIALLKTKKVLSSDLSKDLSSAKGGRNEYLSGRLCHKMTQTDSLTIFILQSAMDNKNVLHFHSRKQLEE